MKLNAMNTIDWTQYRVPAIVYSGLLVVGILVGAESGGEKVMWSLVASGLLCLFHLLTGFIILEGAFESSPTSFLKRVLGGMGIRLTVMLLIMSMLLWNENIDVTWLLLGLLIWYSAALVFEITALQRKVSHRQDIQ